MFEWTVRIGDLFVLVGFIGTLLTFSFKGGKLISAITSMQGEIRSLKEVTSQVGAILTTVAVQKVELEHIRDDIKDLKHGKGFVLDGPMLNHKS